MLTALASSTQKGHLITAGGQRSAVVGLEKRTGEAETLRLEDTLQRREIDDEELAHDGRQDSVAEGPVTAQTHLMDHTRLRTH